MLEKCVKRYLSDVQKMSDRTDTADRRKPRSILTPSAVVSVAVIIGELTRKARATFSVNEILCARVASLA